MVNSGKILRYEAVAELTGPEDAHRKFIIGYFLMDDTVAVWEVKVRNSGCLEGKFKERGLTKDPRTGKPFRPGDFYVGAVVKISAMQMRIVRSDEYSLKYMEEHPDEYPQSSIALLSFKLAGLAERGADTPKTMSPEDFREYVSTKLEVDLTDQELITVLRSCAADDAAEIDLAKLDAISADIKAQVDAWQQQQQQE